MGHNGSLDSKGQLKLLSEFFDHRNCSPYIIPALSGQMCYPYPYSIGSHRPGNDSIDGLEMRIIPVIVGAGAIVLVGAEGPLLMIPAAIVWGAIITVVTGIVGGIVAAIFG
jgi:hypothetical protein